MTHSNVLKTNLLVSGIMLVGFILTAFFSHQANYRASLNAIEQISSLTADGIYYQLSSLLTRPVNIAQTMAQDRLLIEHLRREAARLEDAAYVRTIQSYLAAYREMDHFDSVFLISTATGRYYSANGIDRVLTREDPENAWYYKFLESGEAYSLNVDNDEVAGAENAIAVFVNCKIFDAAGNVVGVVGIGIHTDYLKRILRAYEEKYGVEVFLLDQKGNIQVSIGHTGDERNSGSRLMEWSRYRAVFSIRAIVKRISGYGRRPVLRGRNHGTWLPGICLGFPGICSWSKILRSLSKISNHNCSNHLSSSC